MKSTGFLGWLFKGKNDSAMDDMDHTATVSAEEYEHFITYLRGKERQFSKPGRTVKDEFRFWAADRAKNPNPGYQNGREFAA